MMKIPATLLILSSLLGVRAIPGMIHRDTAVVGCSDPDKNTDKEKMYGVDGEIYWYADFNKGKGEGPQPDFMDPKMTNPDGYQLALRDQEICKADLKTLLSAFKNPPVKLEEPHTPIMFTKHEVEVGVANVLICHVIGFYPAPISISWTRNTLNLTNDITTSVPYPNQDGTFSQFSRLKFTPEQGDIYSCTVNHQSLSSPETRLWDVEVQVQSSVGPDVFCGAGLTIALLGVAMGTFFLIKGNQCN